MGKKPNLVLFMPETIRADAVLGPAESRAKTPNLDRFSEESVVFTNAFAQMSFCTPSRCSMFTGLYPHTENHRSIWHLLQNGERNFFQDLKEAGYYNVVFGKNDVIAQDFVDKCFDEVDLRFEPNYQPEFEPLPDGSPLSDAMYRGKRMGKSEDSDWAYIQSAIDFLSEDHEQPWCLFLPLEFAHPYYEVEEPYFSMHDRDELPSPLPSRPDGERTYSRILRELYGGEKLDDKASREIKATYFGMISRVDSQFGLLLDKLSSKGLDDNTVVAYFSDHGDYAGDYGLIEKFLAGFEDCLLNVPLVLRTPEGMKGRKNQLCEMTDLYPTLLELLGLESKHYHFGHSLLPLMRGETNEHRDAVFAEGGSLPNEENFQVKGLAPGSFYERRQRLASENLKYAAKANMIRSEKYKYIHSPWDRHELYDLDADPSQVVNLADAPAFSGVVADLRERLLNWHIETGDTLPLNGQGKRSWK